MLTDIHKQKYLAKVHTFLHHYQSEGDALFDYIITVITGDEIRISQSNAEMKHSQYVTIFIIPKNGNPNKKCQ